VAAPRALTRSLNKIRQQWDGIFDTPGSDQHLQSMHQSYGMLIGLGLEMYNVMRVST